MKIGLLLVTLTVAICLSIFLWVAGIVPFNFYTFALHASSIYIGVAAVLTYQRRGDSR